MSLSVHTFLTRDDGGMTLLDDLGQGADLAGFESFRTSVWGSDAVRGLGARFFPVLRSAELMVAPEEVMAFLTECALLRANLNMIMPPADPDHSHEWYLEVVSTRLANIEAAARRALEVGGGVVIW